MSVNGKWPVRVAWMLELLGMSARTPLEVGVLLVHGVLALIKCPVARR
jgi:hypothetical protein